MDAKLHVPSDLIRLRFRAGAYTYLYFSWNNHTSSAPNTSYSIHLASILVNLPDKFDARVMKMHYFHPQMHRNAFGGQVLPRPAGSLSAPRLHRHNGERVWERGRGRERKDVTPSEKKS